jgi:hypothetical protein
MFVGPQFQHEYIHCHRDHVTMDSAIHWTAAINIPYILESNPHPFNSFRELKNQMRIRIECGLDSRSRAGFWKNYRAFVVTFFFSFKKVAKTRCGLDSRIYCIYKVNIGFLCNRLCLNLCNYTDTAVS